MKKRIITSDLTSKAEKTYTVHRIVKQSMDIKATSIKDALAWAEDYGDTRVNQTTSKWRVIKVR